jgi:transcriptional regulator with XRE-family HTH domain
MPAPLNVIGPIVRKLRDEKGMTQEQIAAKCQIKGFDLTRGTLAKIESQVRAVSDHEIPFLAAALDVGVEALFPQKLAALARKARNPKGTSKRKRSG